MMETLIVLLSCILFAIAYILAKRHSYYWTFNEPTPPLFPFLKKNKGRK